MKQIEDEITALGGVSLAMMRGAQACHCEERSDEAFSRAIVRRVRRKRV